MGERGHTILTDLNKSTKPQGFTRIFYFGEEGSYKCLVMERLGKSVEDVLQECEGQFSEKSTAMVAEQILCRIEYLHSRSYLHRDIKPENFMFGKASKIHHIYLIDFGLAKKYFVSSTGHSPMRTRL